MEDTKETYSVHQVMQMPTEVPQSITEEETKELLSVHGYKEVVLSFILIATSLLFIIKSPLPYQVNLFLVGLYFIGSFFLFRYLSKNLYKILLFSKSFKNVSFFDSRMNYFFSVKDIRNNTILFNDGSMMCILQVQPIDGSLLEEDEIKTVIDVFDSVLKSIPHTIHISSHSVEPNLDDFFASTDKKIMQQKSRSVEKNLKMNKLKEKWLVDKMRETKARDRENYFAIAYRSRNLRIPIKESVKYLFGIKEHRELSSKEQMQSIVENSIKEVNSQIFNAAQQLEKTGVKTKQLDDNHLINLYPSYFMNIRGIGTSHLSPIMWHEGD